MSRFSKFQEDLSEKQYVTKQNCVMCGHISSAPVCTDCIEEARKYKTILNKYMAENRGSTLIDIYNNTQISLKLINAFLDMGWLALHYNEEDEIINRSV